jgi:ubiquinone/menaquinone biosynthesis C-methylase UbiE
MTFFNVYDDRERAQAYASLEFPGTYYLAYRDLAEIIAKHLSLPRTALDVGCGTGRSTRFLERLGLATIGVDIAPDMLAEARRRDPTGDYRRIDESSWATFADKSFDLVTAIFTFDNIPTGEQKTALLRAMKRVVADDGAIVAVVSSPEIYVNEWASFTTRDFPENTSAQSGDRVRIVMLDVPDRRPVEDVLWSPEAYASVFRESGLQIVEIRRPLGATNEPFQWVSETAIAPWTIYVLRKVARASH